MAERQGEGCLIAIAGAIGSGKSTIATAVSERLNIPVHSIDDDKKVVGATDPDFDDWVTQGRPFSYDFRERVFQRTLRGLAETVRNHPMVIVEETFHRADIRAVFFRSCERLFGRVVLVEIVVSPEVATAHLEKRARNESGHMAGRDMFEALAKESDPFVAPDFVVENNGELEPAVDAVCGYLEATLAVPG